MSDNVGSFNNNLVRPVSYSNYVSSNSSIDDSTQLYNVDFIDLLDELLNKSTSVSPILEELHLSDSSFSQHDVIEDMSNYSSSNESKRQGIWIKSVLESCKFHNIPNEDITKLIEDSIKQMEQYAVEDSRYALQYWNGYKGKIILSELIYLIY